MPQLAPHKQDLHSVCWIYTNLFSPKTWLQTRVNVRNSLWSFLIIFTNKPFLIIITDKAFEYSLLYSWTKPLNIPCYIHEQSLWKFFVIFMNNAFENKKFNNIFNIFSAMVFYLICPSLKQFFNNLSITTNILILAHI